LQEETYFQRHGSMDDTPYRGQCALQLFHETCHASLLCNIALLDVDRSTNQSATIHQFVQLIANLTTASGQEDDMAGTTLNHPSGDGTTNSTSATDN
jgi:hypothetical protein